MLLIVSLLLGVTYSEGYEVLSKADNGKLIVVIGATDCQPCLILKPIIKAKRPDVILLDADVQIEVSNLIMNVEPGDCVTLPQMHIFTKINGKWDDRIIRIGVEPIKKELGIKTK